MLLILLAGACFCVLLLAQSSQAKSINAGGEKALYPTDLDIAEDDGTVDNALMNYLFARQMVNRLRNNLDVNDLQRKRSYWKQCAFNAVSCFGKK